MLDLAKDRSKTVYGSPEYPVNKISMLRMKVQLDCSLYLFCTVLKQYTTVELLGYDTFTVHATDFDAILIHLSGSIIFFSYLHTGKCRVKTMTCRRQRKTALYSLNNRTVALPGRYQWLY